MVIDKINENNYTIMIQIVKKCPTKSCLLCNNLSKNMPFMAPKRWALKACCNIFVLFFLFTLSRMIFQEDRVHNRSKIFHLRMSKWQKWKTFGENFYFYRCSSLNSTWRGVEMFIFWKSILWGLYTETFVKFQQGSLK